MTIAARFRAGLVISSILLLGWGASACSSGTSTSATTSSSTSSASTTPPDGGLVAPAGFAAVVVRVTRPDGTVDEHCLWLADTEASRERGLMGVTDPELGGHPGMLFRFPGPTSTGFWMKNTRLPLTVVWFDADGHRLGSDDMVPCPASTPNCPVTPPPAAYRDAIEVPRGRADALGLGEGAVLTVGGACATAR